MITKNLIIITLAQVFSFTAAPITVFLSGIIGSNMVIEKTLATLPAALMIVGTALGSIFASFTMSIIGRKFGFILGAIIVSCSSLLASYAVHSNLFVIYCLTNFLIGIGYAFTAQYRFAAAESVSKNYIPTAISIILFASILGALIGPNIAIIAKDIIPNSAYSGSYIFLSILTIIPIFLFLFYTNEKKISAQKITATSKRSYLELFSQPKFIQAVVVTGLAYSIMSFLMTATPISMHILNHISLGKTGFIIMLHIIAMFIPSLITGKLIKKFGHSEIMYAGVIILFFSIFFNFINQDFYNYLISLILLGLGWNFLFISGTALLVLSYAPDEKFRAQGLNDFVVFSTQALGALFAGYLLGFFGWKNINLFCIPILILILLIIFITDRKDKFIKESND
jgi:MFS family permease